MRFFLQTIFLLFLSTPIFAAADTAPRYFMTLADIHFDPFVNCGWRSCPLIARLNQADATQWPALLRESDKEISGYGQDSDYRLLHTALMAAQEKAAAQHMQFVLVLGDFLGHDYRKKYKRYTGETSRASYQAFVRKTLVFLNAELAKTFPALDVYMVVGNNDSYQNNYVSDANGAFYHETGALWSTLINNTDTRTSMRNQFAADGYYAVTLPNQANLRLIVLNTVLFSYKARGGNIDQNAQQELNWLEQELQAVKTHHQKALIALHIPPSVDVYATRRIKLFTLMALWKPAYIQRFHAELAQFSPDIMGVFAGHLHSDWFHLQTMDNQEVAITGTPSVSPIFGNNPGFKIYAYSPTTLALNHFATYYYPLSEMQHWVFE